MARPFAWQSFCQNFPHVNKDELTRIVSKTPINDSNTPSHTPTISRTPTPAPVSLSIPAKLIAKYTNAKL